MKALILALMFLAGHASANTVTLETDLDHDGQPDTVSMVDKGAPFYTLEVHLSKSGQVFDFEKLVRNFHVKNEDESECQQMGEDQLFVGNDDFFVHMWQGDIDACASQYTTDFQVKLINGVLMVQKLETSILMHSMGDPGEDSTETMDFANGKISLRMAATKGDYKPRTVKEPLPKGCELSLADLAEKGKPLCAAKIAHFQRRENQIDKDPGAVCPELRGQYECDTSDGGKTNFYSIYRMVNAVNHYDISDQSVNVIANGKRRLVSKADSEKRFQTASCNRDWLGFSEEVFLVLAKNDPRKPLYDRKPFRAERTSWSQLDIEGNHFSVKTVSKYLKDDGTYTEPTVVTKDCKRTEIN